MYNFERIFSGLLPRKPLSSATENQVLSALKEAERAKGPEDESRMGRVFIMQEAVSDERVKG